VLRNCIEMAWKMGEVELKELRMKESTLLALRFSIYLNHFAAIPSVNEYILILVGMTYHLMP
jgi:hypothetical protein